MSLATFEPVSKNPPISKVFREIGLADELGSGMRNVYKYTKMYSGGEPQFLEGDVFRITIPLTEVATAKAGPGFIAPDGGAINGAINLSKNEQAVLAAISANSHVSRSDLILSLGIGKGTIDRAMKVLKEKGILQRIGSNKTGYWQVNIK